MTCLAYFSLRCSSFSERRFKPDLPDNSAVESRQLSISFLMFLIPWEFDVCLDESARKESFLDDLVSLEPNVE